MVWKAFVQEHHLTQRQQDQFSRYKALLLEWNERMNLTAITDEEQIIRDHFGDSIALARFVDFSKIKSICDIGSGAGFPGIPLKIVFPHLTVVLLEVRQKRIQFLQMLCAALELDFCEVSSLDWRSFLRTNTYNIDLFCARASLVPEQLVRMFKPGCYYRSAQLVYWASSQWKPEENVKRFLVKTYHYTLGNKERQYALFAREE